MSWFLVSQSHRMLKGKARIWPSSVFNAQRCGFPCDW